MTIYEQNRSRFSAQTLRVYSSQWLAFSFEGTQILAASNSLADLEHRLSTARVGAEKVAMECIDFQDSLFGGADLL